MAEEEKKAEKSAKIELVDMPTQFEKAFRLPNGEVVDFFTLVATMYNDVIAIKKAVA